jgi:hypothetical protein
MYRCLTTLFRRELPTAESLIREIRSPEHTSTARFMSEQRGEKSKQPALRKTRRLF